MFALAATADGGFDIAFTAISGSQESVQVRHYDIAGVETTSDSPVNINDNSSSIVSLQLKQNAADGTFVVEWSVTTPITYFTEHYNIQAMQYSANLTELDSSGPITIASSEVNHLSQNLYPQLLLSGSGSFVTVWGQYSASTSQYSLMAVNYIPSEGLGSQFLVASNVAVHTFNVSQTDSLSAANATGAWTVIWEDQATGALRGQVYNASDAALGSWFQMNTTSTGSLFAFALGGNVQGDQTAAWLTTSGGTYNLYTQQLQIGPVLTLPISTKTVAVGSTLAFTVPAIDATNPEDSITYSLAGYPPGATINPSTGLFSWSPDESEINGTEDVTVCMSDSGGDGTPDFSWSQTFDINVVDGAAPTTSTMPSIGTSAPLVYPGQAPMYMNLANYFTASNSDLGNSLTYTASVATSEGNPSPVTVQVSGSQLLLQFSPTVSGTATVTVTAKDQGGETTSNSFTVMVSPNTAPTFARGASPIFNQSSSTQVYSSVGWATEISAGGAAGSSGESLSFILTNDNPSMFAVAPTIDPSTGDLAFTLAAGASGVDHVTVELESIGGTSGENDYSTQSFDITALGLSVVGIANISIAENDPNPSVDLTQAFSDALESSNSLSFSVIGDSNTSLFSSSPHISNGVLSLPVSYSALGSTEITVEAIDSYGATVSTSFDLSVSPNDSVSSSTAPEISDLTLADGTTDTYGNITASSAELTGTLTGVSDPADEVIEFSYWNGSSNILDSTLTDSSGDFTYTPTGLDAGDYDVSVRAEAFGVSGSPATFGPWATIDFDLTTSNASTALPAITSIGFASGPSPNPVSSVPYLSLALSDAAPSGTMIEFDDTGSGVPDYSFAISDESNANFSPNIGSSPGQITIRARVAATETNSGVQTVTSVGPWYTFSFVLASDPTSAETSQALADEQNDAVASQAPPSVFGSQLATNASTAQSFHARVDTGGSDSSNDDGNYSSAYTSATNSYSTSLANAQASLSAATSGDGFDVDVPGEFSWGDSPSFDTSLDGEPQTDEPGSFGPSNVSAPSYTGPSVNLSADTSFGTETYDAENTFSNATNSATANYGNSYTNATSAPAEEMDSSQEEADDTYSAATHAAYLTSQNAVLPDLITEDSLAASIYTNANTTAGTELGNETAAAYDELTVADIALSLANEAADAAISAEYGPEITAAEAADDYSLAYYLESVSNSTQVSTDLDYQMSSNTASYDYDQTVVSDEKEYSTSLNANQQDYSNSLSSYRAGSDEATVSVTFASLFADAEAVEMHSLSYDALSYTYGLSLSQGLEQESLSVAEASYTYATAMASATLQRHRGLGGERVVVWRRRVGRLPGLAGEPRVRLHHRRRRRPTRSRRGSGYGNQYRAVRRSLRSADARRCVRQRPIQHGVGRAFRQFRVLCR